MKTHDKYNVKIINSIIPGIKKPFFYVCALLNSCFVQSSPLDMPKYMLGGGGGGYEKDSSVGRGAVVL